MGNWSLCVDQFPEDSFLAFQHGVYWNDAIYWIRGCHSYDGFVKLDIKNQHPVLTALPFPLSLDSNDGYECMLFESGGSLLLGCKGDASSQHFTIYEKRNEYSEWSQKYIVSLDDIIKPFPISRWSRWNTHYCIHLGKREKDSFLVMKLDKKVLQYNIVSRTLSTIFHLGPNDDLVSFFPFIPSFASV